MKLEDTCETQSLTLTGPFEGRILRTNCQKKTSFKVCKVHSMFQLGTYSFFVFSAFDFIFKSVRCGGLCP